MAWEIYRGKIDRIIIFVRQSDYLINGEWLNEARGQTDQPTSLGNWAVKNEEQMKGTPLVKCLAGHISILTEPQNRDLGKRYIKDLPIS